MASKSFWIAVGAIPVTIGASAVGYLALMAFLDSDREKRFEPERLAYAAMRRLPEKLAAGKGEEAIAEMKDLIRTGPAAFTLNSGLGLAYCMKGDVGLAALHLGKDAHGFVVAEDNHGQLIEACLQKLYRLRKQYPVDPHISLALAVLYESQAGHATLKSEDSGKVEALQGKAYAEYGRFLNESSRSAEVFTEARSNARTKVTGRFAQELALKKLIPRAKSHAERLRVVEQLEPRLLDNIQRMVSKEPQPEPIEVALGQSAAAEGSRIAVGSYASASEAIAAGLIKESQRQRRPALEAYSTAIRLSPKAWLAYSYRGILLIEMKDCKAGVSDLRQAVSLNAAYRPLAQYYLDLCRAK